MNEKGGNQPVKAFSKEEYLMSERRNATKSEFSDGKVVAKAGSGRWHNLIASNATIAIGSRLQGNKCDVYVNDMLVQLKDDHLCYPNLVIVNGEPAFTDQKSDVLLNPTVVMEIYSSSTNSTDKMRKLESYLAMDSIRECLLVKVDEMRVEHYAKQNAKQWIYKIYNEREDVISLDSVNCKISISELYSQIKFRNAEFSSTAVN